MGYHEQLTGETQLRARRTRIKILRAIADRNGMAGFSDIKVSTGLSTGSIYYHLERMGGYVTKDSKHYMITEEGLQFLRESDPKYSGLAPPRKEEQVQEKDSGRSEEPARQSRFLGARQYIFAGITVAVIAFVVAGVLTVIDPASFRMPRVITDAATGTRGRNFPYLDGLKWPCSMFSVESRSICVPPPDNVTDLKTLNFNRAWHGSSPGPETSD